MYIYYHTYILHTKFEMNIVLVHGAYVDGSSWGKVITILKSAGYHVIAVQLPLHSLADDVTTVKRTIELVGGPIVLVGHSYGGFVITNAAYNNHNVKPLCTLLPLLLSRVNLSIILV